MLQKNISMKYGSRDQAMPFQPSYSLRHGGLTHKTMRLIIGCAG